MQVDTYDPEFFPRIAQIEDRHFWFCARNRIIAAAARSVVGGLGAGYRVLEVGCGTGVVLRELVEIFREGEVVGMDLHPEAVAFARQRVACPVVVGDVLRPPNLGEFNVVGIFDVLEHLHNDSQILAGLNRLLKPDGRLIITVPAHMSLWSYFDVAARHRRRYDSMGLARLLEENGFEVEYLTEFMMSLFPLIWLLRRINGGRAAMTHENAAAKASGELRVIPIMNGFLKFILTQEVFAIDRRCPLPFGTSLLAVARKSGLPATSGNGS